MIKILILILLIIFSISIFYNMKSEHFTNKNDEKKIYINEDLELTKNNYDEIDLVFRTLTNFNRGDIIQIIANDSITDVYKLCNIIIKNQNQNKKLTINSNTKIKTIKNKCYFQTFGKNIKKIENYKILPKLIALSNIIKIPTLPINKCLKIINNKKIFCLYELYLQRNNLKLSNLELLGIEYYFGNNTIPPTFYKLIQYLEIFKNELFNTLDIKTITNKMNNIYSLKFKNFENKVNYLEKQIINKNILDYNLLLLIFYYHKVIDLSNVILINNLINSKTKYKYQNSLIDKDIEKALVNSLNNLDLEKNIFKNNNSLETILVKYDIKEIIKNKLNEYKSNIKPNPNTLLFNIPLEKPKDLKPRTSDFEEHKKEKQKSVFEKEYKIIKDLNVEAMNYNNEIKNLKYNNIINIQENFSDNINNILNDIVNLFSITKKDVIDFNKSKNATNPSLFNAVNLEYLVSEKNLDKYLFYFKNIILILIKEERLIYTGLLLLMITIAIYFIEITK